MGLPVDLQYRYLRIKVSLLACVMAGVTGAECPLLIDSSQMAWRWKPAQSAASKGRCRKAGAGLECHKVMMREFHLKGRSLRSGEFKWTGRRNRRMLLSA